MSFQYIYPQYLQKGYMPNYQPVYSQVFVPNIYMSNPYQASFYNNQGMFYPYMPNFNSPITNFNNQSPYVKIGELASLTGEKTHMYRLSNGHEIAILPRKNEATIVKTYVDAGSITETDEKRGVHHVNEHGLFMGSSKLENGDVFKMTSQMGASTNASTDMAEINYYITSPYMGKNELKKTLEIQGDMIYNPKFDKDAMESEKGPVCSEISMINDDPSTRAFDKVIRNLFQIKSNSQNLVAGSIDTVQGLTREDMVQYHNTYYSPENLHTVIVADDSINPDEIMKMVSENFRANHGFENKIAKRQETLTPIQSAIREDIRSSKTNFTSVMMGFCGPKPKDSKDFVIQKMIDFYLGQCSTSDLKNKLEKMNASYSSTLQKTGLKEDDPYAMVSVMALNPNEEQKGLDIFYDAIQKLQTSLLSDDDMKAIKTYIKKDLSFSMSDSESLCNMLGGCMLDESLDLFQNYEAIANSITKEDIMHFAQKYYDLNKVSIVVVHPTSVSESDIKKNYAESKYAYQNVQKNMQINQPTFMGIKAAGNQEESSTPKISTNSITEYISPTNNTHLAINKTDKNVCIFDWNINTAPIKPKNPNIPAVLMYMLEKGTEYRQQDEFERYKELNGIDSLVHTNGKSIEVYADCLPEDSSKALALMNELLYHPKLTQNDFEKAKKSIKNDLMTSQKDAQSNLLDNMYPGYFPTTAQKLKTIDSLTLDDIKEFYNELLKNASSYFVATIPKENSQNIESEVVKYQSIPNVKFKTAIPEFAPIFEANKEANVVYDTDDLNQAQIYQSYKFPLEGNAKDEAAFEMVNMILGATPSSRLFSDLREKQNLAYSVSSSIQSFENTGIITLKIQSTTDDKEAGMKNFDNVQKSLDGFKKHINLLCTELVTDEELKAAKENMKKNLIGQLQNPVSQTGLIAMNMLEPYGIKRIDEYSKAIDQITKEDIQKAAKHMFSYNPTISVLASKDTIDSQLGYLKTLGKLEPVQND